MNEFFIAEEATINLKYHEIESIVAFLLNFEKEDIPETLREEILPRLREFLAENY